MSDRPSHAISAALIISLCINLVLVGILGMAAYRIATHQPVFPLMAPQPPGPGAGPGNAPGDRIAVRRVLTPRIYMAVAPDKAGAIRDVVKAHRDRIEALRTESMAARREVMRLFGEPTLDKAAFDRALTRMRAADIALGDEALKVASESSALLSPEDRQKVLQWQPRFGGGMMGHNGPHRDHGPRPDGAAPPEDRP